MLDEIDYFNDIVWVGVSMEEALSDPEAKIVGTRWVNCNKADLAEPDVRARLVAQELSIFHDESFYAATPPLEAKRLLFSTWASEQERDGKRLKLSFVDVRKAYFNGRPNRKIYVRPPPELGLPKSVVCRLER